MTLLETNLSLSVTGCGGTLLVVFFNNLRELYLAIMSETKLSYLVVTCNVLSRPDYQWKWFFCGICWRFWYGDPARPRNGASTAVAWSAQNQAQTAEKLVSEVWSLLSWIIKRTAVSPTNERIKRAPVRTLCHHLLPLKDWCTNVKVMQGKLARYTMRETFWMIMSCKRDLCLISFILCLSNHKFLLEMIYCNRS